MDGRNVSERLQWIRSQVAFGSLQEYANAIGVPRTMLANWLRGKKPSPHKPAHRDAIRKAAELVGSSEIELWGTSDLPLYMESVRAPRHTVAEGKIQYRTVEDALLDVLLSEAIPESERNRALAALKYLRGV